MLKFIFIFCIFISGTLEAKTCDVATAEKKVISVCKQLANYKLDDISKNIASLETSNLLYENCDLAQIFLVEKKPPYKILALPFKPWVAQTADIQDFMDDVGNNPILEALLASKPDGVAKSAGQFHVNMTPIKANYYVSECILSDNQKIAAIAVAVETTDKKFAPINLLGIDHIKWTTSYSKKIDSILITSFEQKKTVLTQILSEIINANADQTSKILGIDKKTLIGILNSKLNRSLRAADFKQPARNLFWLFYEDIANEIKMSKQLSLAQAQAEKLPLGKNEAVEKMIILSDQMTEMKKNLDSLNAEKNTYIKKSSQILILGVSLDILAAILSVVGLLVSVICFVLVRRG